MNTIIEPGDILEVTKSIDCYDDKLGKFYTINPGDHIIILKKRIIFGVVDPSYIDFTISYWGKTGRIGNHIIYKHCRKI